MPRGLEGNTWGGPEDPNLRRRNPREKEFIPIEEIPDPGMNPEEALIAGEEDSLEEEDDEGLGTAMPGVELGNIDRHKYTLDESGTPTDYLPEWGTEEHPKIKAKRISEELRTKNIRRDLQDTFDKAEEKRIQRESNQRMWGSVNTSYKTRLSGRTTGGHGREHENKHEKGGDTIRDPRHGEAYAAFMEETHRDAEDARHMIEIDNAIREKTLKERIRSWFGKKEAAD